MSYLEGAVEVGPSIFVFDNFIDNSEEIVAEALKRADQGLVTDAQISKGREPGFQVDKEIRETLMIDIAPVYSNDVMWWLLAQKIWQCGDEYAKDHSIFFSNMELPQFLVYRQNEGFYSPHVDTGRTFERVFSAVLYLNDVEVGGETYFEKFDLEIRPIAGRLVMFPANYVYRHGAKTPESSDKYCIVTWFAP
jgi:hypothetical protein